MTISRRSQIPAGFSTLALLLFAFALRVWDFGNPVIHVDEQFYLLVGDRMLHGALPYVDLWDRKPLGLFLIFAAIRLLPGDDIVTYQVVATLFAATTAWLVAQGARRVGASGPAALVAGMIYLVWLSLLSGRGGQSPVFYNLFITGAAILTFRLPALADRGAVRAIVANGAATCVLAGLAIQTKYTPAIESAFFGLVHVYFLRRAGGRAATILTSCMLWIALGVLPTALVVIAYWLRGAQVFDAYWFSNFASITLRKGYPAAKIVGRLAGTGAQLALLAICAVATWRARPRDAVRLIAFGWLGAALIGYAIIGAFFDHYALPLVAPLAIVAAPTLGRYRIALIGILLAGLATVAIRAALRPDDAPGARALAHVVEANSGRECPYVFAGDSITYYLAHACIPTRYAFPSTLAYAPEQGATGIDEAGEVRRIMAGRPPVVVTLTHPLAPWNPQSRAIVAAALAGAYRPIFATRREEGFAVAYLRRDRMPRR